MAMTKKGYTMMARLMGKAVAEDGNVVTALLDSLQYDNPKFNSESFMLELSKSIVRHTVTSPTTPKGD